RSVRCRRRCRSAERSRLWSAVRARGRRSQSRRAGPRREAGRRSPARSGSSAAVQAVRLLRSERHPFVGRASGAPRPSPPTTSPATDPHDYEPTAADARTLAGAQIAIVNGIGYDPWAPKLIAANPVQGRIVLTVGDVVGIKPGGNPHRWYLPGDVQKVIGEI